MKCNFIPSDRLRYLSKSAEILISNNIGYRCDNTYGSGVKDFKDILHYETCELYNEDIYLTLTSLYGFDTNNEDDIIDFCKSKLNTNSKLVAKWVCTSKEECIEIYCDEHITPEIEEFILPDNYLIVSDLSSQGQLIVYEDTCY